MSHTRKQISENLFIETKVDEVTNIKYTFYYNNVSELHNEDGPALIITDPITKQTQERYYLNDKEISKDEFLNLRFQSYLDSLTQL